MTHYADGKLVKLDMLISWPRTYVITLPGARNNLDTMISSPPSLGFYGWYDMISARPAEAFRAALRGRLFERWQADQRDYSALVQRKL